MIISDAHKFAFIHIPKCAGSSVKAANKGIDNKFPMGVETHDKIGTVDFSHLPLWAFRDYFPDIFSDIAQFESFAVTRDPVERFGSGVMQRCRQYLNFEAADITPQILIDTALEAIAQLRNDPKSLAPDYIHFARQADYIQLEGETIVKHVDLPGTFTHLNNFLKQHGLNPISTTARTNASVEPANNTLKKVLDPIRPIYRAVLPKALKDRLWLKLIDMGIYAPQANRYDPLMDNKEIMIFIDDFYADDFEIYRKALAADKKQDAAAIA